MPYKAVNGGPSGPYKALKGLIRPLRAPQGLSELYKGLKSFIRPLRAYEALKGFIRLLRAL